MKHADAAALDKLENLPSELRNLPARNERSRGVLDRRAESFPNFDDDPQRRFADLHRGAGFERLDASPAADRRAFVEIVRAELNASS
ncbi:hypothetical protein [Burkholderia oklahomensis]|uniref:hypothetical protein n=1 Tax=Burkholderia oklahomensis TaxID=342113 RepID=UPI000473A8C1|nr:hypothetical protein [Burkholderia oklahomensis]AJX33846.1 hypothetical protein BG90_4010 [Burkholderia oklahomensis C6786]MBI0364082.1 hypothetical protein [Burkholderia oklahomensis]SUY28398.1 Uncharacterised protein [Burkholderia oklahomensis]